MNVHQDLTPTDVQVRVYRRSCVCNLGCKDENRIESPKMQCDSKELKM